MKLLYRIKMGCALFMSILMVFLCFGVTLVNAAPNGNLSEKQLDKYLTKAGYPQEALSLFPLEQKQHLYDLQATYVSHQKGDQFFGDNPADVHIDSLSNFSHNLYVSSVPDATGYKKFVLDYYWDWKYSPTYTLTDKFGISWSDSFDAIPSTAVYNYKAIHNPQSSLDRYCESNLGNTYTYTDYTLQKGIGWSVNLIGGWTSPSCVDGYGQTNTYWPTNEHKGWGEVQIHKAVNSPGTYMSSAAVADYFHKQGSTSGSLSFNPLTGSISISITPSTDYDKSTDAAANWTWQQ